MRFLDNVTVDYKTLGARIKKAREEKGLSQEEFAALLTRDQAAISEYENGKRKLSAVDLFSIAKVLQLPILYFYEGSLDIDDLDNAIIHEFHRLPTSEAKQSVVELVRVISNTLNSHSA